MRSLAAALTAALILAASPFAARADAGVDDAPDHWQSAMDVRAGAFSGDIGAGGDFADWYRVGVPSGMGARVTLHVPTFEARHALVLLDDEGRHLAAAWMGWANVTLEAYPHGAMRVGVLASAKENSTSNGTGNETPAQYHLSVQLFQAPDFAVEDLRVTNRALRTDILDVPPGHLRTVHVDVANLGGAGRGWLTVYAETPSDGRLTHVADAHLFLGEGETRALSFDWDAKGIVGDVVVRAWLHAEGDSDWSNGDAEARHYVLVGGTGAGHTLYAPFGGQCLPLLVGYACAGHYAEGGGAYAYAQHGTFWSNGGAYASADGRGAYAGGYAFGPGAGASAGAWKDLLHGGGYASGCAYRADGGLCYGQPLP